MLHVAPEQLAALADGQFVESIEPRARRRQRLEQRAVVGTRLDQHDPAVRQVRMDFFAACG